MDSATHLSMGIALGAIAMEASVQGSVGASEAIMLATIAGSLIPDIDVVMKLRGNAYCMRNHRGLTHSLPFLLLWPTLLASLLTFFYPEASYMSVWLSGFVAVGLHILVDLFNAYGTKGLAPFSQKWISVGMINTFDPFIFSLHVLTIGLWLTGATASIFIVMYLIILGYYGVRYIQMQMIRQQVNKEISGVVQLTFRPTIRFSKWKLVAETEAFYHVLSVIDGNLVVHDVFAKKVLPASDTVEAALLNENIQSFLSLSPAHIWEITESNGYTSIMFTDLRYRSKDRYNFVAVAHVNRRNEVMHAYTGWVYNEKRMQKKIAAPVS